jgi:CRP/FNR family transcriptional regulator
MNICNTKTNPLNIYKQEVIYSAAEKKAQVPKISCATCKVRDLCLPPGLNASELEHFNEIVGIRRKVKRGEVLFRNGENFTAIYAIHMGFFKTYLASDDGRERVTGFQMAGDTNGLDGIGNDSHTCESVALEDGEVCVIPFIALDEISYKLPLFKHHAYKLLSREIVRYYGVMLMLGSMRAEERVAVFLLNLFQRLHTLGFSKSELVLRMSRQDIGNYLGLTLETVSRTLSKLMDLEILTVKLRRIKILNLEALKNMTNFGHAT